MSFPFPLPHVIGVPESSSLNTDIKLRMEAAADGGALPVYFFLVALPLKALGSGFVDRSEDHCDQDAMLNRVGVEHEC